MAVIKCKMCGGDLNTTEGLSVVECEYCGSRQTIPTADNEKKLTLFARAGRLLRDCEFDKASGVFESLVADFPEEAEAYWGLVLCKYGIEYVDDPATGKKVPTCHRSSFDSVLDDQNFEQACENGDAISRRVYRDEARQIEDLRKGIIEVSGKEAPYDIFISYKETDDQGNRTLDSVIAQEIYNELTEKGYRVFFSRISLEDKLGVEYEPYIFAALNSAKLMLAVGTDYEHFDAVWVKNEWSRFLKLISSGQKKVLIPVFKNMDAYDMPKEFAKLSAQDMGKVGAMQDLLRGVEKILGGKKEEKKETVVIQQSSGGPNVNALLKRGEMALTDGKWDDAKGYYDRVLDMDAECGEAYLGMFLVENQCRNVEEYAAEQIENLSKCQSETLTACEEQTERVRKAVEDNTVPGYLTAEELAKLFAYDRSYTGTLRFRQEQLREMERFFAENRLLSRAKQYASPERLEKLNKTENTVFDFLKNAISKAKAEDEAKIARITREYAEHLKNAEDKAAQMGQEAQAKQKADKQKNKKTLVITGIIASVVVLALAVFMIVTKVAIPTKQYNAAMEQFTGGDYEGAIIAFESLGDFKDSAAKINEVKYAAATELFANGEYVKAGSAFEALGDYEDSAAKSKEAKYAVAMEQFSMGDYAGAEASFKALGSFSDSAEKCMEAKYAAAEAKYAAGDYHEAAVRFFNISDYKDSKARYIEAGQKSGLHQTVSAGNCHTVGLKSDGTVVATKYSGDYYYGECDVSGWENVVAVSAGWKHTVGLKSDGTVVATKFTGKYDDGQCDVSGWTDIVAVSAGDHHTVGLKSDGTVVATKYSGGQMDDHGQCNVRGWTDIVAVSAGLYHTVGLKSDGTVVATKYSGGYYDGQCDVSSWKNIVAVSAGSTHTVGLKADGTVVAVGNNEYGRCDVSGWTDIVAVSAGSSHTVGLKADGTVVATKYSGESKYNYGQCDVSGWTDIVAVSAGLYHTAGLRADGTVVTVGRNNWGQCNVGGWSDIVVPEA